MGMHPTPPLNIPFLRPEKEQPVFLDRTTDCVTIIVAAQHLLVAARASGRTFPEEEIPSIEQVVPSEVINIPVILVRSTLGNDVDLSAARAAVLRPITVALNLELFNAINRG